MIPKFFNEERGVTMIEYGLIAALIGLVCVVTLTVLGDTIENVLWQAVSTGLNQASP